VALVRRSPQTKLSVAGYASELDIAAVSASNVRLVVVDPRVARSLPPAFELIDASELYESLFGRVALTFLDPERFLDVVTSRQSRVYALVKRAIDVCIAALLGIPSLLVLPLVWFGIKLQDGGVLFYQNVRVGERGAPITVFKYRSMTGTDVGTEALKSKLSVTPLGRMLRMARIDELPQLWNVLRGDLSLIGPRPELPALVEAYTRDIPHYMLRHTVRPGLSGWAQIYHDRHPHHGTDLDATREKLSYDLYYIKHRSLVVDFLIALKTIRIILTFAGR
jgi:lipopolysaccharide/colanic/teichoic acid biosynthesis glycosyltransferase